MTSRAKPKDRWASHVKLTPHINRESIEQALRGFPIKSKFDCGWLAAACREAALWTVGQLYDDYPGTQSVRRELDAIVASIEKVKEEIAGKSLWAESILRRFAVMREDDSSFSETRKSRALLQKSVADWKGAGSEYWQLRSSSFRELHDAIDGLDYITTFIRSANEQLNADDDPARWKDAERRKERIALSIYLSRIFTLAFDKQPTVNNWPDESGNPKLGPWPDFYRRVACLIFQTERIPDIVAILKEGRRQQKLKGEFSNRNFLDRLLP